MKIYTRTGDKGQTSLFNGKRVGKSDDRISLLGTLDELNSFVGVLMSSIAPDHSQKKLLEDVQSHIFTIGSEVANPELDQEKLKDYEVYVVALEESMDLMDKSLDPLQNFILPGGTVSASNAHVCRTIARRCERAFFSVEANLNPSAGRFLNRLSDYFFVLARYLNKENKVEDVKWLG